MNKPETEKRLERKVKSIRRKAEKIVNKGIIGETPFNLEKTLECHQQLKNLLEKMEYNLEKDIPTENVLKEISNIEKEMNLIQKETER